MKIKTTVRLVEYSQSILLLSSFLFTMGLLSKARDGRLFVLELGLGGAGVLAYVFRSMIITRILKKSAHPGLIYSVFDKLGLTDKLDLDLPDELLDEIYKPSYSTAQFLQETQLKTDFGYSDCKTSFRENGLHINDRQIPWPSIFDWIYHQGSRTSSGSLIVNYYDSEGNIANIPIPMVLGLDKIDALLLLTHFKGKYGQSQTKA